MAYKANSMLKFQASSINSCLYKMQTEINHGQINKLNGRTDGRTHKGKTEHPFSFGMGYNNSKSLLECIY